MLDKKLTKKEQIFVDTVWGFYAKHGRKSLPWRKTKNPYRILVSEVMLQQTQVERVIPKYKAFLKEFPTIQKLADASLGDVLRAWQGLGYNRRAKMLHQCAKQTASKHNNKLPRTSDVLGSLSGIGPYTAGAIMAFSYNKPVAIIETNIRTVFLHHFFKNKTEVTDKEILQSIGVVLDKGNPREWYWALMDYGADLKKEHGNPNSRGKTYIKQSKFEGSDRQIRGAVLRLLTEKHFTRAQLYKALSQFEDIRMDAQLEKLLKEGMIVRKGSRYQLPN